MSFRPALFNLAAGVNAAATGQAQIHQHHFRTQAIYGCHRFVGGSSLADDGEIRLNLEQRLQAQAHYLMVVN